MVVRRGQSGIPTKKDRANKIIFKELNAVPLLDYTENYRYNWAHEYHMKRNRIRRQMKNYMPNGKISLGRPNKRWKKTIMGF